MFDKERGDAFGIRLLSSLVRRSAAFRARFLALFARSPSLLSSSHASWRARVRVCVCVCFLIKEKKASNVASFDLLVVVSVKAVSRKDRKEKNKEERVRSSFVHLLTA